MSERKAWTAEEDSALRDLYEERGIKKWAEISRLLQADYGISHRNGKQCRQRYHNHLDNTIRREKWTSAQENHLLELQSNLGNHWADIARHLQGRSENTVKNQFYCIMRRGVRKINSVVRQKLKRFKEVDISIVYKIVDDCENKEEVKVMSIQLKRQLIYFGMNQIDTKLIEIQKIKNIIQKIKSLQKSRPRKKIVRKQKIDQKEESEIIESDQYRDDFPVTVLPVKKNSLYSFSLEKEEQNPKKQQEDKIQGGNQTKPQVKKSLSLQSLESLTSRLEHGPSKIYDIFGTEVNLQNFTDFSRFSPQGNALCDSPYFDQIRSSFSSWGNSEQ